MWQTVDEAHVFLDLIQQVWRSYPPMHVVMQFSTLWEKLFLKVPGEVRGGGYSFANKANLKELVAQQENKLFLHYPMHKSFKVGRNLEPTDFACRWHNLGGLGGSVCEGREGGRLVCEHKERIECS